MPHQNRDTVPHGIEREIVSANDVIARLGHPVTARLEQTRQRVGVRLGHHGDDLHLLAFQWRGQQRPCRCQHGSILQRYRKPGIELHQQPAAARRPGLNHVPYAVAGVVDPRMNVDTATPTADASQRRDWNRGSGIGHAQSDLPKRIAPMRDRWLCRRTAAPEPWHPRGGAVSHRLVARDRPPRRRRTNTEAATAAWRVMSRIAVVDAARRRRARRQLAARPPSLPAIEQAQYRGMGRARTELHQDAKDKCQYHLTGVSALPAVTASLSWSFVPHGTIPAVLGPRASMALPLTCARPEASDMTYATIEA